MAHQSKPPQVADSWDEEPLDSIPTSRVASQPTTQSSATRPPAQQTSSWDDEFTIPSTVPTSSNANPDKRPEKSTAVASRLIAAGLGVKAPRRTEEQREYERAVRAQERKRKEAAADEARRQAEERENAKAAVWGD